MKIAVVGTGYVGLVVGACFAENGNDVICVDNNASKVRSLKRGKVPLYEPGLQELVDRNQAEKRLTFPTAMKTICEARTARDKAVEKRLTFSTALSRAVRASQIVFIAVGTPADEDGAADLKHVLDVARSVARAMNGYMVIATKSTVPAGTAARLRETIRRETTHPFSVVTNPEFLKQGAAIDDFMRPDRVVIGAEDEKAAAMMRALYAPFTRTGAPIMVMDCASAELSKYAANAMLATRVSLMNEMANVCELYGADVDDVRKAIASDRRIGSSFLFPGIGYGGSCFPKDVKALISFSRDKGYNTEILRAVDQVNQTQKGRLVEKLKRHFGSLKGKTIALWGLAFKPRTDDMREAPSINVIEGVLASGGKIQAYDPQAERTARAIFGAKIDYVSHGYEALKGADALAIVTEWNEFREPDFARMRALMREPVIFDGRNLFTNTQMSAEGFTYYSIGRS